MWYYLGIVDVVLGEIVVELVIDVVMGYGVFSVCDCF